MLEPSPGESTPAPRSVDRPKPAPAPTIGVGLLLAWAGIAGGVVAVPAGWKEAVIDDAFITFRYAKHLVEGQGLVFNPGERVEGFTSLLWTLLSAAALKLGLEIPGAVQLLGIVCNLLLAVTTYLFARRRLHHSPFIALIAPMLLVANLNVGAWAAHGLETPLFSLLLLVGLLLAAPPDPERRAAPPATPEAASVVGGALEAPADPWTPGRALAAGLLLAAATWTRPEGSMYFVIVLGVVLLGARRRRPDRRELAFVAAYALPVAALFLWRYSYYGQWLPNTFYAKASGGAGRLEEGGHYLLHFFDETLVHGLVLIPLTGIATRVLRGPRPLLIAVFVATLAYALRVGGDAFAGARFFVPVLAPLYLLLQDGLSIFLTAWRGVRPLAALFAFVMGLATLVFTGPEVARQAGTAAAMTRNRVYLGHVLRAVAPPDTLIALNTVGALPYYAGLPTLDLYGLTDAHIARQEVRPTPGGGTGHEKGDGAYVLSREPGLILLRNVWLADVPIESHRLLHGVSEREIVQHPIFLEEYEPMNLRLRSDLLFGFYKRKDPSRDELESRFKALELEALGPLEALSAERGTEMLYFSQGAALFRAGRLEAAQRAYEKALELYPDYGEVHLALGQLHERAGTLPAAREHYTRATQLLTESATAWLGLGNVEAKSGLPAEAVRAYERAIVADPGLVDAYANLAGQLIREGKLADAIPVLRDGLARAPTDLEMWVKLGTVAGTLQRWGEAREALNRATQLDADDPKVVALKKWLEVRLPK